MTYDRLAVPGCTRLEGEVGNRLEPFVRCSLSHLYSSTRNLGPSASKSLAHLPRSNHVLSERLQTQAQSIRGTPIDLTKMQLARQRLSALQEELHIAASDINSKHIEAPCLQITRIHCSTSRRVSPSQSHMENDDVLTLVCSSKQVPE